jgi:hypothetical protein
VGSQPPTTNNCNFSTLRFSKQRYKNKKSKIHKLKSNAHQAESHVQVVVIMPIAHDPLVEPVGTCPRGPVHEVDPVEVALVLGMRGLPVARVEDTWHAGVHLDEVGQDHVVRVQLHDARAAAVAHRQVVRARQVELAAALHLARGRACGFQVLGF